MVETRKNSPKHFPRLNSAVYLLVINFIVSDCPVNVVNFHLLGFKMKQKVANKVNIRIANLNAERTRLEIKSKVAEVEIDKEKGIREKISQTIKEMADTSVSVQKQLMDLTVSISTLIY